ncbi:MAG TPA: hypothetical protein PK306_28385 [Aquabacterium sp.]|nr:hypothetical protein [Aquabacterium sp.]HQC99632.1 hypothetical protein [Aquabacterium sp.]
MPCTEHRILTSRGWLGALLLLAGCGQTPVPQPPGTPSTVPPPASTSPATPAGHVPAPGHAPIARSTTPAPPAWRRARDWDDFRQQAALRIVALHPDTTYLGAVPEPLLAIPVLEVDLNGDGSVRRIQVLRRPTQAFDTVQLAIDAVQRAAPFGSVAHLPRPWRFTETFLFDAQRRFKPRTLDF